MMRFGRMPLFPMQTSEQLREEGRQINLERLISDIAGQPLKFEHHPWMKEMMDEVPDRGDGGGPGQRDGGEA